VWRRDLRRTPRIRRRPLAGLEALLWRVVSMFRILSCAYAAMLTLHYARSYTHPLAGYVVIGVMAGWSALSILGYARRAAVALPVLLGTDLAVALGCLLATRWIVPDGQNPEILPMLWVASAALNWGVVGGSGAGALAAFTLSLGDVFVRDSVTEGTLNLAILILLPSALIGYVADLATRIEEQARHAAQLEAATVERERLARAVHDSVLQVLALVQRRGAEIGGPAAELGRLAGEQETALRALVSLEQRRPAFEGTADLCTALRGFEAPRVTIALPATRIPLASAVCAEITAAVRAALDNVAKHTPPGACAWILAEQAPDGVVVTVRDDGPGIAPGRLAQAEAEGRLGIAQSIRRRVERLGGSVVITAPPGQGTEIELRVPATDPAAG
jgi:signal transduction histidine kinase